jgi:hypothetical protein
MERRPNTQTVQFFLELAANDQLDLQPAYQRRSVWSDEYRRFFVDSVLRDYPCPAIYLDVETRIGSPTVYHVIDGQQRLRALIGYSRDEFHLGEHMEDLGHSGKFFSQLPPELQNQFVSYVLTIENLSGTNELELEEVFDRLNRNVARLNRQELRNARFSGEFITRMEDLSQATFWSKTALNSKTNIRRMRDVEFVSELFLLTMHGIQDGGADLLDDYYAAYDDGIPDEDEYRERYDLVLSYLGSLDLAWRQTRWRNLADIYGLWAALLAIYDETDELPDENVAVERLTEFSQRVEAPEDPVAQTYSTAVRAGASKDTNREERARILVDLLTE